MQIVGVLIIVFILFALRRLSQRNYEIKRQNRRNYYRDVYLKSEEWKRKRHVVLKRDNWRCVHCGKRATQVHHKRYAKYNIGKEPIEWLESVCESCHDSIHHA